MSARPNLAVDVGGIHLKNPVTVASGTFGYGREYAGMVDVRALGAVSVLLFDHDRLKRDLAFFPGIMAKLNFNISGILGKRLAEVVGKSHSPAAPTES